MYKFELSYTKISKVINIYPSRILFQGTKYGFDQSTCDDLLYRDMLEDCTANNGLPSTSNHCRKTAYKWGRLTVDIFGFLFFTPVPPSWCNMNCVKNYMLNKRP